MADENMIAVEVAYALAKTQKIISVQVPIGTTAIEAAKLSGIKCLKVWILIVQIWACSVSR
jgi:putative ubiquitin-RnfH superfamily antitoxin RatB of RatAB toxin-antitoxin module